VTLQSKEELVYYVIISRALLLLLSSTSCTRYMLQGNRNRSVRPIIIDVSQDLAYSFLFGSAIILVSKFEAAVFSSCNIFCSRQGDYFIRASSQRKIQVFRLFFLLLTHH
jgi:hypothetical protein